jgi:hypothetical protein
MLMQDRTRKTVALTAQLVTAVTEYTETRFRSESHDGSMAGILSAADEFATAKAALDLAVCLYARHLGGGDPVASEWVTAQIDEALRAPSRPW